MGSAENVQQKLESSLKILRKKGGNFPAFATAVAGLAEALLRIRSPDGTSDVLPYSGYV